MPSLYTRITGLIIAVFGVIASVVGYLAHLELYGIQWAGVIVFAVGSFVFWAGTDLLGLPSGPKHIIKTYVGTTWRGLGRTIHGTASFFSAVLYHWFFTLVLPGLTAAYYTVLQIGQDWHFIKDHRPVHDEVFFWCIVANVAELFFSSLRRILKRRDDANANAVLADFIGSLGSMVEAKVRRFRDNIMKARPAGKKNVDKFLVVTYPDEQIEIMAVGISQFIKNNYDVDEQHFNMSIFHLHPHRADKWQFCYRFHPEWRSMTPEELMKTASAARKCAESGEHRFFPSKAAAEALGMYTMSDRDRDNGKRGSVFLKMLTVSTVEGEHKYIISMSTYGKQLCESWDRQAAAATESFLLEFTRRISLELCLKTFKHLKYIKP